MTEMMMNLVPSISEIEIQYERGEIEIDETRAME
jgi:hypothetical protein